MTVELPEPPDFRATVTRRRVTVLPWVPWLATGGPLGSLVRARGSRGVTLADITAIRDADGTAREAIVDVLAGGDEDALRRIVGWASTAGYERVWLPDTVVDTEPHRWVGRVASTRCRTCGGTFADRRPEFWLSVRRDGLFPTSCPICNGDLPQWTVHGPEAEDAETTSTGQAARG